MGSNAKRETTRAATSRANAHRERRVLARAGTAREPEAEEIVAGVRLATGAER